MLKIGLFIACFSVLVIWVTQGNIIPGDDVAANSTLIHNNTRKRILTPEENELANEARAHIAKVLERNLIRLFAAISAQQRQSRQEEDDGAEEESAEAFNPNTLPQVAQLLGAIFSGNLNLTSVVDQAFYLVPQTVRNQVNGIFKLLSGQSTEEPPPAGPAVLNSSARATRRPRITTSTESAPDAAAFVVPGGAVETTSKREINYKTKWRNPTTIAPVQEEDVLSQDDELLDLEKELVIKAKEYAPYAKKKEPRFFVNSLQQLFAQNNLNLTQVIKVMPDLFKGARQAFILLEDLGVLPDGIFPGLDADDEDD